MRGHGMGGGGRGGGWGGMRSVRQDRAVLQHRVKKGTARRMLTFAVPYRKILAVFLPVVIIDAAIGAVNPLILRALIDNGILKKDSGLVVQLAVLVAILAVADAGLVLTERRISAYIGESLIFDMRSKVFRHIQRMPLAFFSTHPDRRAWSAASTTTSSAPSRPSPTCSPTWWATSSPW